MAPGCSRVNALCMAARLAAVLAATGLVVAVAAASDRAAGDRPGAAGDQERRAGRRDGHVPPGSGPGSIAAMPECTCRAGGLQHAIGAQICLGARVFRCAMDLNVTSWQATGAPCPES